MFLQDPIICYNTDSVPGSIICWKLISCINISDLHSLVNYQYKCLDTTTLICSVLMLQIHCNIVYDLLQCYFNGPIHTWHIFHCEFAAIFLQCNFFTLDPFLSCNFCSVERFFMLKLVALLFVFYHR